jgi:hypothetical protein
VTSNGLNIYVQEDDVCTEFYRNVARSLKPLGFFILSFITPHDQWRPKYTDDLERQGLLFKEVVPVRWSCMRDEHTTRKQLSSAGFKVIEIRYDSQRMFPAVVAQKA